MRGDDKRIGVAGALHLGDRHGRARIEGDGEAAGRTLIDIPPRHRGQRIDVRRPVIVEIELLVIGDAHALLGAWADGEDAHLERLVIDLFEQTGVAANPLIAVVDFAGALLLEHFADHLLAVDPHAEVRHRSALGNGEGVKGFDLAVLSVDEDLLDFGDGNAVVDGHLHIVLLDFQCAAQPTVGDEQSGGRGAAGDRDEYRRRNNDQQRDLQSVTFRVCMLVHGVSPWFECGPFDSAKATAVPECASSANPYCR